MHDLLSFVWRVPVAGYQWRDACALRPLPLAEGVDHWRETPERFLTHNIPIIPSTLPSRGERPESPWRTIAPLREAPDLFRGFANLPFSGEIPPLEEAVRQFANTYGALGIASFIRLPDGTMTHGESLTTWYEQHYLMRVALDVWEALKADDLSRLQRWFTPTDEGSYHTGVFHPDEMWPGGLRQPAVQVFSDALMDLMWGLNDNYSTDPTNYRPDFPTTAAEWAMLHLRTWINLQLEHYTSPRLQWAPSSTTKAPMRQAIVPRNLLGAMWLQLALEIEGQLRYERCQTCGTWFRVPPKANRPSTRFCKDYCRVKWHRQARRAAAGRSARR
jgi:hypothetical protein